MTELLLLTCLQSNFIISKIQKHDNLQNTVKKELVAEVMKITRRDCRVKLQ
jgi:hypothetical protein